MLEKESRIINQVMQNFMTLFEKRFFLETYGFLK